MKSLKLTYLFTIVFSVVFFITSCNDDKAKDKDKNGGVENVNWKSNVFGSIDGTIAFVGSFDFMEIMDKSSIMDADIIPEMYKSMFMGYIDSDNLGIKLEGNNHYAVVMDNNGEFDYAFAFANVLDAKKIATNLHMYLGGRTDNEDGYEFLKTSDGVVFGWDDQHLIAAVSDRRRSDVNQLKNKIKKLLDARNKDVEADDQLLAYLKRDDDINMYMNMKSYMDFIKNINMNNELTELYSNEEFLKLMDYTMVSTANFNNGEIIMDLKMINNGNGFKYLKDQPVGAEYLNYLTDNDRMIASAFANIDLDTYISFLKPMLNSNLDVYNDFNDFLTQIGLSENEIFNIFNGELAISIIDILEPENSIEQEFSDDFGEWEDDFFDEMDEYGYDSPSKEPVPSFLFTLGINDQSALMKLMANAPVNVVKDQVIEIENDVHLLLKDNKLFLGSPQELMNKLNVAGSLSTYSKINSIDYPVYCYFNTDASSYPDIVTSTLEREGGLEIFRDIMSLFNSFEIKGTNNKISYEIIMSNKGENSLKQIMDMIIKLAKENNPGLMNV